MFYDSLQTVVVAAAPVGIPKILPQKRLPRDVAATLRAEVRAFAAVIALGI